MGLRKVLLENISKTGFENPTPVQAQTIPAIMEGKDMMACAQTGTGKTAAFVLPALHKLLGAHGHHKSHGPKAIILTPTRELAEQVLKNIRTFAKDTSIKTGSVIGGVAYGPQIRMLKNPLDILVATPGRLIDHMGKGLVDFSRVEFLILDEADRMLDMGFLKPIEKISSAIKQKPQILLFSATFDKNVEKVAGKMLKNPERVHLAPTTESHKNITQFVCHTKDVQGKKRMLSTLLEDQSVWQAIIFTATKRNASKLAEELSAQGHKCDALHGDMRQNARKRTVSKLHHNKIRILVATDVAARGLDVKGITHIFNFDMPQVAEDYIHRIGRTGRGNETGIAISLIGPKDRPLLRDIEKMIKTSINLHETLGDAAPAISNNNSSKKRTSGFNKRGGKSFGNKNFGNSNGFGKNKRNNGNSNAKSGNKNFSGNSGNNFSANKGKRPQRHASA